MLIWSVVNVAGGSEVIDNSRVATYTNVEDTNSNTEEFTAPASDSDGVIVELDSKSEPISPELKVENFVKIINQDQYAEDINANLGDQLNYKIVITNIGDIPLFKIQVTDSLPEETIYLSGLSTSSNGPEIIDDYTLRWEFELLDVGDIITIEFKVEISDYGVLENFVEVFAQDENGNELEVSDSSFVNVECPQVSPQQEDTQPETEYQSQQDPNDLPPEEDTQPETEYPSQQDLNDSAQENTEVDSESLIQDLPDVSDILSNLSEIPDLTDLIGLPEETEESEDDSASNGYIIGENPDTNEPGSGVETSDNDESNTKSNQKSGTGIGDYAQYLLIAFGILLILVLLILFFKNDEKDPEENILINNNSINYPYMPRSVSKVIDAENTRY